MDPPVHVTTRTIFRYKAIIEHRMVREVRKREGLNKTVEELALELKKTYEEVNRELWKQYHAPVRLRARCPHLEHKAQNSCGLYAEILINSAMVKVAALKEIREMAGKQLEIMQSLGLVAKAPEKHQMVDAQGNPIDPIAADKMVLNQQFMAFVNATFKDPVGVNKGSDTPGEVLAANEETSKVSS